MRRTMAALVMMLCLLLAGCGAKMPYDLSGTTQVEIHAYTGEGAEPYAQVVVDGKENVMTIIESFSALSLKKMDYVEPSVAGYDLYFRNAAGEQIAKLCLPFGPTPWVICGSDAYAIQKGSINMDFIAQLVETAATTEPKLLEEGEDHAAPVEPLFFDEPPELFVQHNSHSIQALRGTSSWQYMNPDGTSTGIEADSMHPLDAKEYMPVIPAVEGELLFGFDTEPDEIMVRAWPISEWGNLETVDEAIEVPVSEFKFEVLKGGHIYEVFAKWERFAEFVGSAHYSFYTSPLGVTMTAKDVTPTGLTLVCIQSGGFPTGELQTGSPFWLESYSYGNWEKTPRDMEEIFWTAEAWIIPQESSVEWSVNWENIYSALPAGRYRIGKEIMDFRGPGDYDTYHCYAEFEIK